jgi:hypothetical protein
VPAAWTRPADVRETIRKKWATLLAGFAAGQDWAPLSVPLRGPGPSEIGERLAEVQRWAAEWEKAAHGPLRVEYKKVGGRVIGTNLIPCRAWIDGYDEAWRLLGAGADVAHLVSIADRTAAECPRLVPWLARHPVRALRLEGDWDRLLATVRWIDTRQVPGMYLRQVDVPGVDTKFIERHRGILAELLDLQLAAGRIDPCAGGFEGRYGFRKKPAYIRFRLGGSPVPAYTELSVRADELTAPPALAARVYVVENEITYLAFPLAPDAIVIFGGGYAAGLLESLGWLADLDIVYWGDIDTHGFTILSRLRRHFPAVRSMLMDRDTLLAHRTQWVTEATPTTAALDHLAPGEDDLYRDLVSGTYGAAVRLEQERVSFGALARALAG